MTVYETIEDPDLARRMSVTLEELPSHGMVWMAFFSPSSASMVLPHLRRLGLLNGTNLRAELHIKVAAIGGTTRKFLEDEGVEVNAVAEHPSAEGLSTAMKRADGVVRNAIV